MHNNFKAIYLAVCFFTACTGHGSKDIIPKEKMKSILVDIVTASEWNNVLMAKDTTLRNAKLNLQFYQAVFEKHHITKDQFYNSYHYYNERPSEMKILLDSTYALADRLKGQLIQKR